MPKRKTTRNAPGGGSIRQRPDGRWEARYTVGRDPGTGKQVRRSIYGDTQADVRKKLQQVCIAIDDGAYVEPSKMPLSKWLDTWFTEYTGNVKEHTRVTYETQCRVHIKPALGAVALSALRPHEIQAFYNRLRKGTKDVKGLSSKTIKNIHGVLHRALDQAVIIGYLKTNPCIGVMLPRLERPDIKPLMDEQVDTFLDAIEGNEYTNLFTVTMYTGMRQSEVMGLTWDCVKIRLRIFQDKSKVSATTLSLLFSYFMIECCNAH